MDTKWFPFIVLTGRPGSGKSTLLEEICSEYASPIRPAQSTTTRPRRGDEKDGEYNFVTEEKFQDMDRQDLLAWKAQPYGPRTPWYGTTNQEVLHGLQHGNRIAILSRDSPFKLFAIAKAQG